MYQKKAKLGTPVAINYRENKCYVLTVFIKCVGLKTRFKLRGLCFRGLCFRGLRFLGLRSVVCVFEVCVF